MSTERHAYAALRRLEPTGFWQRVENSVGTGLPDVFCRTRLFGGDAWVENKVGALRKNGTVICRKSRTAQHAWLTGYTAAGGRGIIAVWLQPELYLFKFTSYLWHALKNGDLRVEDLEELHMIREER